MIASPSFLDLAALKEKVRYETSIASVIGPQVQLVRRGSVLVGLCPLHEEKTPSFTVYVGPPDRYHCYGCRASGDVISLVMHIEALDFPTAVQRLSSPTSSPSQPKRQVLTQPIVSAGLTVEELAKAKGLPVNFLQSLGCRTTSYCDNSAVLIPYHDEAGKVVAVRYRLSLNNADRFRWRRGDHATLYGLDRLADIRKHGWVLLVEGETDSWTCWLKDQPALGMPGKETWKPEWARLIRGVQPYLWVEPGADSIIERVAMDLPGLLVIPAPKD